MLFEGLEVREQESERLNRVWLASQALAIHRLHPLDALGCRGDGEHLEFLDMEISHMHAVLVGVGIDDELAQD